MFQAARLPKHKYPPLLYSSFKHQTSNENFHQRFNITRRFSSPLHKSPFSTIPSPRISHDFSKKPLPIFFAVVAGALVAYYLTREEEEEIQNENHPFVNFLVEPRHSLTEENISKITKDMLRSEEEAEDVNQRELNYAYTLMKSEETTEDNDDSNQTSKPTETNEAQPSIETEENEDEYSKSQSEEEEIFSLINSLLFPGDQRPTSFEGDIWSSIDDEDLEDDTDWDEDLDIENHPQRFTKSRRLADYVRASESPAMPEYGFNSVEYPYTDRMDPRQYIEEKFKLQIELLKMQRWVKQTGARIVVLCEGRDAAGKGGTIKRLTENLNPRGTRVIALDKPTEDEKTEWFFQRYIRHLPHGGEVVFFDRSWYNRAGVEIVMGFCTFEQYLEFMRSVPYFEEMLVNSGTYLIKFWFSVTREEQQRRFQDRATHTLKQWKLSPMDIESSKRWDQYSVVKELMFSHTHRTYSPWVIIRSNDKFRARLNAMRVLLSAIPYEGKDVRLVSQIDTHIVGSPKRAYRYPMAKGDPLFTRSQVELLRKTLTVDGVKLNYKPDPEVPPPETEPVHYWTPEELPPEQPLTSNNRKHKKRE